MAQTAAQREAFLVSRSAEADLAARGVATSGGPRAHVGTNAVQGTRRKLGHIPRRRRARITVIDTDEQDA